MFEMSLSQRVKCAKCGKKRFEDEIVSYHRFPNPGKNNLIKALAWAKYCWPDQVWTNKSLITLHKTGKFLCGRHFASSQFYDNKRQKLSIFAVPDSPVVEKLLNKRENVYKQDPLDTHNKNVGEKESLLKERFTLNPPTGEQLPIHISSKDVLDSSQEIKPDEADTTLDHDQCRCCLKTDARDTVDIERELECFNIQVSKDSRMSRRVCATCGEFLQQARRFRDMVVASQRTLLAQLDSDRKPESAGYENGTQQDLLRMENERKLSGETNVVPERKVPDDAGLHESRAFSQLTHCSDMLMDIKENYKSCTTRELANKSKKKRKELSKFLRENLITILDNSTLLPFISVTGVKFDCIYCELSYPHIEQLRTHVEEQHRNEETSFQHDILKLLPATLLFADISVLRCRLCDETFTTIDKLVEHLVGVHEKKYHNLTLDPPHNIISFNFGLHIWKCLECETTLPDYKKLRLHVIKHYGTYLCHQCGSKFLYDKHYHQHILTHKNINQNKRTCEICGQSFKNKRLLLYHHYRNHYNITADRLKRDMTQALEPADKEEVVTVVYACSICQNGTSFTDLHAAYMHRIGHLNNTREGPFVCEICKYSSSVKKDFRVHLQAHYGIKNYVCEVCKKTFRKSSQLSDHMNSHLNLRFPCPLCDSILYNKNELICHVKYQHPDVTVDFSL